MNFKNQLHSSIACLNIVIAENDKKEKEQLLYKIEKFHEDLSLYGVHCHSSTDTEISTYIRSWIEKGLEEDL